MKKKHLREAIEQALASASSVPLADDETTVALHCGDCQVKIDIHEILGRLTIEIHHGHPTDNVLSIIDELYARIGE